MNCVSTKATSTHLYAHSELWFYSGSLKWTAQLSHAWCTSTTQRTSVFHTWFSQVLTWFCDYNFFPWTEQVRWNVLLRQTWRCIRVSAEFPCWRFPPILSAKIALCILNAQIEMQWWWSIVICSQREPHLWDDAVFFFYVNNELRCGVTVFAYIGFMQPTEAAHWL